MVNPVEGGALFVAGMAWGAGIMLALRALGLWRPRSFKQVAGDNATQVRVAGDE